MITVNPVNAQGTGELSLRMTRNFGYSSGTGKIQGAFTLKATGPETLERVTFFIDGEPIGEVSQPPFHLRFNTDDYPLGLHRLHAVGDTTDGEQLHSNEIQAQFVTAEEGIQAAVNIVIPLLGFILAAVVLSMVFTMVTGRKMKQLPPGAERDYGVAGGAICPRCSRPYSRHFWAPNLLVGKLERCPFCGKWAVVAAAPIDVLRAAERAELDADQAEQDRSPMDAEERLRKDLEDSRYQDL